MSNDTTNKKLQELKEEISSKEKKIKDIEELLKEYPDLEIIVDRWRNEFYISKTANSKVSEFYTKHSCGCCSDSPLFAYPYVRINNGLKIHSNPYRFCIGEKDLYSNSGEKYLTENEIIKNLEKENISRNIIEKLAAIIKGHNEN